MSRRQVAAVLIDLARRWGVAEGGRPLSVATVLDRYGHLLPGQEDRVTDALDAMCPAAQRPRPAAVVNVP